MFLKILSGPLRGRTIRLDAEQPFSIGRHESCSLPLDDARASRRHCSVEWAGEGWRLRDLGSANGTRLNCETVREHALKEGDSFEVGRTVFEVVGAGAEAPAAAVEAAGSPPDHAVDGSAGEPVEVVVDRPVQPGGVSAAVPRTPAGPARRSSVAPVPLLKLLPVGLAVVFCVGGVILALKWFHPDEAPPASTTDVATKLLEKSRSRPLIRSGPVPVPAEDASATLAAEEAAAIDARAQARWLVETLAPLLAGRRFESALNELARFETRLVKGGLGRDSHIVREAAMRILDAAKEHSKSLEEAKQWTAAKNLLRLAATRLPQEVAAEARVELERLEAAASPAPAVAVTAPAVVRATPGLEPMAAVYAALACLDFDAAREALQRTPQQSGGVDEDIRLARQAWARLTAAADAVVGPTAPASITLDPFTRAGARFDAGSGFLDRLPSPGEAADGKVLSPARALGREDDVLGLGVPDTGEHLVDLLSLADTSLAALVPEAAARDGLALLVFLRKGRARGERLARELSVDGKRLERLRAIQQTSWRDCMRARLERISAAARKLEKEESKDIDAWRRGSLRLAEWMAVGGAAASDPPQLATARDAFLLLRGESLRLSPPAGWFHATEAAWQGDPRDGLFRFAYDFKSQEQTHDFRRVGTEGRLGWQAGELQLEGECRFLHGAPFEERMMVKVESPAGGYQPNAPNVNLALWTHEGYSVTARRKLSLTRAMQEVTDRAVHYIVYGTGFRAVMADYGGSPLEQVRPQGEAFVDLPAHVLFAASHFKPLNGESGQCWWAEKIGGLGGGLRVEASFGSGACRWRVNEKTILSPADEVFERLLPLWLVRNGSFNIFTNGRALRLRSLEVSGRLNPSWLNDLVNTRVKTEIAALGG